MEIPEGWNRWKNNTNLLPDDMAVWITKGEKDFTADLMKEMAKALQIHVNGTIKQLKLRDPYQAVGYEALKRWGEWK